MKMIFKIWTVLCLGAVLSFSAMAQTFGLPKLKKGETYRAVRVKMLRAGWKPFHAPDADECAAGDKRCEGRPEMERCSGTGVGACRFLWKKGGKTVALLTAGENVAIYQGFRAVR
ncbi:MAG: hypothetical protein JSS81_21615 [Acidobacteria bacterium]|nr:hypothetical protein [Acidobacteriota bacterium]